MEWKIIIGATIVLLILTIFVAISVVNTYVDTCSKARKDRIEYKIEIEKLQKELNRYETAQVLSKEEGNYRVIKVDDVK